MKKLKIVVLVAMLCSLSGCGYFHRLMAHYTDYSTICVTETHVTYIQFTSGAAVLVDQNGKPVPCK